MSIRYFKNEFLNQLKIDIEKNLDRYKKGSFEDLINKDQHTIELPREFNLAQLKKLKDPKSSRETFEAENSELVFKTFDQLTPLQAREERIWAYLCHSEGLDHVRKRWLGRAEFEKKNIKDSVSYIRNHFFAENVQDLRRNNGLSRLWTQGFLGHRAAEEMKIDREEVLKVFLKTADVRMQIVDRPSTSTSIPVFCAIWRQLKKSYDGEQILYGEKVFRPFMKELNRIGGVQLLNYGSPKHLDKIMEKIISEKLNLSEI